MAERLKTITHLAVRERRRYAEMDVLRLLPKNSSELRWSALAEKAKAMHMAKPTLSAHLKRFVRLGWVSRRVDNSTYPPGVFYKMVVSTSELSEQQKEELHKLRDDFLESLGNFIDSLILIGDVGTMRKLIELSKRIMNRHVKKLKEEPT